MPFIVWHPEASGPCSPASFGTVINGFYSCFAIYLTWEIQYGRKDYETSQQEILQHGAAVSSRNGQTKEALPNWNGGEKITAKEGNNCFCWNSLIFAGICSHIYSNAKFFTVLSFQISWPFQQNGTNVLAICWFKCVAWVWFVFRQKHLTFSVSIFFKLYHLLMYISILCWCVVHIIIIKIVWLNRSIIEWRPAQWSYGT